METAELYDQLRHLHRVTDRMVEEIAQLTLENQRLKEENELLSCDFEIVEGRLEP